MKTLTTTGAARLALAVSKLIADDLEEYGDAYDPSETAVKIVRAVEGLLKFFPGFIEFEQSGGEEVRPCDTSP